MYKFSALFILLFGVAFSALAQESTRNVNELWTGFSLKYKLDKKYTFSLEQQTRTTDNLNNIKSNFFELGVKRKFNKVLSAKFQYRYTIRSEKRNVNRFSLDGNAKWKLKKPNLSLNYRMRMQHSNVVYTGEPFTFLRNKFQVEYNLSKLVDPYAGYEMFFLFQENEPAVNRYTIGLNWRLNKELELKSFLRIDKELNKKKPEQQNVFALLLSYGF